MSEPLKGTFAAERDRLIRELGEVTGEYEHDAARRSIVRFLEGAPDEWLAPTHTQPIPGRWMITYWWRLSGSDRQLCLTIMEETMRFLHTEHPGGKCKVSGNHDIRKGPTGADAWHMLGACIKDCNRRI